MSEKDFVFLGHILESVEAIESFVKGISKEIIANDRLRQNAVIRELEIIGEAVKNVSNELKEKYRDVEWKKITGTRDKLIHYYFGLDFDTIWDVLEHDLPELKEQIKDILSREKIKNKL